MRYRVSIIETKTYEIFVAAKNEDDASQKAQDLFEFEQGKGQFELIDEDWNVEDIDEEG